LARLAPVGQAQTAERLLNRVRDSQQPSSSTASDDGVAQKIFSANVLLPCFWAGGHRIPRLSSPCTIFYVPAQHLEGYSAHGSALKNGPFFNSTTSRLLLSLQHRDGGVCQSFAEDKEEPFLLFFAPPVFGFPNGRRNSHRFLWLSYYSEASSMGAFP
jgi:hypothetical protein